jgi:diguanylate cyclase (GGDEF)-like protein
MAARLKSSSRFQPASRRRAADPQGATAKGLDPSIEAEYARARLAEQRTLIRLATACAVLTAALRAIEQAFGELWHPAQTLGLGFVLAASCLLALLAWSRAFERFYLPLARVAVPGRNAVAALFIGGAAAHGQVEMLMLLPFLIISPLFFLGLPLRIGLFSVALSMAAFLSAAVAFDLALPIVLRASVFVLVFGTACVIGASQLENWSRRNFLESQHISDLAQHDPLTGLNNRRIFDEQLNELWQRAVEQGRSIAMLLIDVDHFKSFNDQYGHQAGDRTLQRVAQSLQQLITRPLDVLARYGGEEFGVILYDIGADEAETIGERMRRAVSQLAIEHGARHAGGRLTISVGVAFIEPSAERQSRGALQLADQALYEAKVRGRNRVVLLDQAAHRLLETGVFSRAAITRGR